MYRSTLHSVQPMPIFKHMFENKQNSYIGDIGNKILFHKAVSENELNILSTPENEIHNNSRSRRCEKIRNMKYVLCCLLYTALESEYGPNLDRDFFNGQLTSGRVAPAVNMKRKELEDPFKINLS